MLVFGKGKKKIASVILEQACSNCEAPNMLQLKVYQPYGHFFWVPVLPLRKIYKTECRLCKDEQELRELPNDASLISHGVKTQFNRRPLWSFSIWFILAIGIPVLIVLFKQRDEEDKLLLQNPIVGDVYDIRKSQGGAYSYCKVDQVFTDSVYLRYCDSAVFKWTHIGVLKDRGKELMKSTLTVVSRSKLLEMKEKRVIISVERKNK